MSADDETPANGSTYFTTLSAHVTARQWREGRRAALRLLAGEHTAVERFRILENLCACEWGLRDFPAAQDAIDAASELLHLVESDHLLGNHFNNLGLLRWKTGRLDDALIQYAGALYHYERVSPDLEASVLNNIGCVLTSLGRYDEALSYLRRAQDVYEACGEGFDMQLAEVHKSQRKAHLGRASADRELLGAGRSGQEGCGR